MLDPRAREVLPNWRWDAHLWVGNLQCLGPLVMSQAKMRYINDRLGGVPEFQELFVSRFPYEKVIRYTLDVRDLDTGKVTTMYVTYWNAAFPPDPFWNIRLVPKRVNDLLTN